MPPRRHATAGRPEWLIHPATLVVALVLVVSHGLSNAGAVEHIARYLLDASRDLGAHIRVMSSVAAANSGFMNSVASLALPIPVDLQAAEHAARSGARPLP